MTVASHEASEQRFAARDLIAESRERFVRETAEHAMEILHDDGLYRHLRFKKPGTSMYYFDLVTWPGSLAITGDCDSFLFSRIPDMFEFFAPIGARRGFEDASWGINPGYWSGKLQAPKHDAAQIYSYEVFRARVLEWFSDVAEELEPDEATALRMALDEQVLADHLDAVHSEHEAHNLLNEFEHNGRRIHDSWEWSLREYDWSFLWCCWAIIWGISQYRAAQVQLESQTAASGRT